MEYACEQDENGGHTALDDGAHRVMPGSQPRQTRRLSDKVLVAFHQACDVSNLEIAKRLLTILEIMLTRVTPHPEGNRRRSTEGFVAAHERLWHLQHPPAG